MPIKKVQKNDKNKDKLIKKMILNCKSCKTGLGDFKNTRMSRIEQMLRQQSACNEAGGVAAG